MTDYPFGDKPIPPQFSMQGAGTAWFFSPGQSGNRTSLFHAGHTIPNNIYDDFSRAGFFQRISGASASAANRYQQDSYAKNGDYVPSTKEDSLRIGVYMHAGDHPACDSFVRARIEEIELRGNQVHGAVNRPLES